MVSHDDRVSEVFWTHGCGFLTVILETVDSVLRTLSANENVGGSGVGFGGVNFSVSGRDSRGTLKSRFISW